MKNEQWVYTVYTGENGMRKLTFEGFNVTVDQQPIDKLTCTAWRHHPADTLRNNDVVITSKRRHFDVITSKWRCDVITTLLLRQMFGGLESHYDDVTMSFMASQITSLTIVYSTVHSDADQRKHQSSASLAFVRGIHRGPVNSPHKWPVTRKMFPFDDVIMGDLMETSRPVEHNGYIRCTTHHLRCTVFN